MGGLWRHLHANLQSLFVNTYYKHHITSDYVGPVDCKNS
jgi:hypothetical protein